MYEGTSSSFSSDAQLFLLGNSRLPNLIQSGKVDIHLFRDGDDGAGVFAVYNQTNPTNGAPGALSLNMQDSFFDANWTGVNISTPFFFTIAPSGTVPQEQALFRAIRERTTLIPYNLADMN